MNECHILEGLKTRCDPSHIFSGVKTPNSQNLRTWLSLTLIYFATC